MYQERMSKRFRKLLNYPSPVSVIQEFMKPRTFTHPVFSYGDEIRKNQEEFVYPLIFIDKKEMVVRWQLFARR